jgi:hypothetical protein
LPSGSNGARQAGEATVPRSLPRAFDAFVVARPREDDLNQIWWLTPVPK